MTTLLTAIAVFGISIVLAIPLGQLFAVELRPGRCTHLDGLRALAALMVVCSHYLSHASLITGDPADVRLIEALGAVGVQIFFCITGFLFTRKAISGSLDIGALISSRIRRIVPLYVVVMTASIALAIYIVTSANKAAPILPMDILRSYAYGFFVSTMPSVAGMSIGGQAGQMWTLAWEWRFYVAVPFIGILLTRRGWGFVSAVGALGALAIDHDLYNGMPPWAFFMPGIVCALLERRINEGWRAQVILSTVGVAGYLAALSFDTPVNGIVQTLMCSLGFAGVMFGHRALLSARPLRLLGEVSYSVYMLHLIVASLFWVFVQGGARASNYQTPAEKLPVAALFFVGMLVLSFATYAAIERPFMKNHPSSKSVALRSEAGV